MISKVIGCILLLSILMITYKDMNEWAVNSTVFSSSEKLVFRTNVELNGDVEFSMNTIPDELRPDGAVHMLNSKSWRFVPLNNQSRPSSIQDGFSAPYYKLPLLNDQLLLYAGGGNSPIYANGDFMVISLQDFNFQIYDAFLNPPPGALNHNLFLHQIACQLSTSIYAVGGEWSNGNTYDGVRKFNTGGYWDSVTINTGLEGLINPLKNRRDGDIMCLGNTVTFGAGWNVTDSVMFDSTYYRFPTNYSPKHATQLSTVNAPPAHVGAIMESFNNGDNIVIYGGGTNGIYIYHEDTNSWTDTPIDSSLDFSYATGVVYNNILYFIGPGGDELVYNIDLLPDDDPEGPHEVEPYGISNPFNSALSSDFRAMSTIIDNLWIVFGGEGDDHALARGHLLSVIPLL